MLQGVRGERHRVLRRLRAGVHRDGEPLGRGGDERAVDLHAFLDPEEHALARRAADERAVEAPLGEEPRERTDRLEVEPDPALTERRHRRRQRTSQRPRHARDLRRIARGLRGG